MNRVIQNNFTGGLLSDVMLGRTDLNKYANGLEECVNWIPQVYGGLKTRPGMKYVGDLPDMVADRNCRLIPFVFSFDQSYILVFTHLKMRIIKDGGFVLYPSGPSAGEVVEITSPYNHVDIHNLRYCQITDTMYITHPSYERQKLQRTNHHLWTFTDVEEVDMDPVTDGVATSFPAPASGVPSFRDYIVTAVDASGIESEPDYFYGLIDHPWPAGTVMNLTWTAVAGAASYNVYKAGTQGYGLIGRVETPLPFGIQFVDDNIRPDMSWGRSVSGGKFAGAGDYPLAVGMFEQRMFYGGSNNQPQTVIASQTALLDQFRKSSPLQDTDLLEYTLFSELSERIMHYVSMEQLFVFTSESEKILDSGANTDALTPTSVKVKTRSRLGCSDVRPQVIGGDVVFVHRSGQRVYNLFYSLEADGFDTTELTMLVPGLFGAGKIKDWAWDSTGLILWVVTDGGILFSLTYDRKQQVWAWAKHVTFGSVLSVGRIESRNGSDTYVAVRRLRDIGGVLEDTFQIEVLFEGTRTNPKKCFCVDSGLVYIGAPATTISGLDHLIGMPVAILADGGVVPQQVVSATGQITLEAPASEVIAGLPFNCVFRPTRLNVNSGTTTIQNMPKLISNVALRVINTRGLTVSSPNDGRMIPIEIKPRRNEPYAEPSALQSGDVRLAIFGSWGRDGYIEIRQDNPLPAHVTAIIAEVELED